MPRGWPDTPGKPEGAEISHARRNQRQRQRCGTFEGVDQSRIAEPVIHRRHGPRRHQTQGGAAELQHCNRNTQCYVDFRPL